MTVVGIAALGPMHKPARQGFLSRGPVDGDGPVVDPLDVAALPAVLQKTLLVSVVVVVAVPVPDTAFLVAVPVATLVSAATGLVPALIAMAMPVPALIAVAVPVPSTAFPVTVAVTLAAPMAVAVAGAEKDDRPHDVQEDTRARNVYNVHGVDVRPCVQGKVAKGNYGKG